VRSIPLKSEVIYEGKQDAGFLDRIAALPEGESLVSCIQCGTCSGSCPAAFAMDHAPRKIFAMIRAGMKDQVLDSMTPWVCASCYKCTVNCPKEIRITDIMYALKRMATAEGKVPSGASAERFSRIFTNLVVKFGRGYELGLMLQYMLFREPWTLMKQAPLGAKMFFSGRMPLLPHKIKDAEGFTKIVQRAIALGEGGAQ
jgi:heterodisulfide reductase subunit C